VRVNRIRAWPLAAALIAVAAIVPTVTQSRPLVVGSSATYPPFAYETPAKEIVGFDVDIIRAIAANRGLTLRIVNTPFTGIFAALNNGDIDLIVSGVTINDRRRQSYDFTMPYFEARQLIAVHRDSSVRGLQDLAGKKVGVVTGSTGDDIASRAFGKTSPNIRRFDTTPLVISELAAHGVDAAIGDNGVIAYRVQERKDLKTVSDPSFPQEYFGVVVKQGNTALRDALNAGLQAIIADGTYARIYRQWFQTEPPKLPAK
jgi:polar amino acid transport system substrate-binding protein